MANYSASAEAIEGGDVPDEILLTPNQSINNRFPMLQGDTITFTVNGSVPIKFGAVSSSYMTCNRSLPATVNAGQTIVFTCVWGGAETSINIPVSASQGLLQASDTFYIKILENTDDTPSNWTFPDESSSRPGSYKVASKVVEGTNVDIVVSISGPGGKGVKLNPSSSTYYSSRTVAPGQRFYYRVQSPPDYNQSYTYTLTGGSASDSFKITNGDGPDPNDGAKIPSSLSLPISLHDIGDFFGRSSVDNTAVLSDYVKGGDFVPTITENANIPTSTPISISQFANAYTALYFEIPLLDKFSGVNTQNSSGSASVAWWINSDYKMGFGYISNSLEYRVTLKDYVKQGPSAYQNPDATLNVASSNWSSGNANFSVSATASQQSEVIHLGTLLVEVRSPYYPSVVVSQEVDFNLSFSAF